jgi:osmotically-inducible protein OsmY
MKWQLDQTMNKFLLLLLSLFLFGCGPSLVTTGAKTVIGQNQDEKSFGESWDDVSIKLGIKEKYFSYDATLFTKIDVEVELGVVLLTGVVPFGDMRLEAVRLAWQQEGVVEILNEISIDTGYGLDDIAKDKFISTQLFTKVLGDREIKKFKYDHEVFKQVIYLFGVSNDQNEINRVIDHAKSIKGVVDVINYIQPRN